MKGWSLPNYYLQGSPWPCVQWCYKIQGNMDTLQDWKTANAHQALAHLAQWVAQQSTLGVEPDLLLGADEATIRWRIDLHCQSSIHLQLVPTLRPVQGMRIAVFCSAPAINRGPAEARAHACLLARTTDLACTLLTHLSGCHWTE